MTARPGGIAMTTSETRDTILMYGTTWCSDCARSKRFLDGRSIPFEWINIEEVTEAVTIVRDLNNGMQIIPTIVLPDGKVLAEPSDGELARALDLRT